MQRRAGQGAAVSAVPDKLRISLAALALLTGVGGGAYAINEAARKEARNNAYIQAVAADQDVSDAVRIAMVMASYYESSNRHIGTPYVDKVGRGQPLTVCNGLTGPDVVARRYYSPADCYRLEKARYLQYEITAGQLLTHWGGYGPFQKAVFLDFIHNKGDGALEGSTMRRLANAGALLAACAQNPRWNRGTVNGVSTVLPGLDSRGKSNGEICATWGEQ